MPQTVELKNLEKKVAARKKLIEKFATFAESIAHKRGRVIKEETHSAHTNVVTQLSNFGDFSFLVESGMTMFGGNKVTIWFHKQGGYCVFNIYYQASIDTCMVYTFDEDLVWQRALHRVIRTEDAIAARMEKEKQTLKKKETADNEKRQREERLKKDASRLRL